MSNFFRSIVSFNDEEIEFMISDLKDILGRLRERSVLDFSKDNSIKLLDADNTRLQFKRTELREIKRFISLVWDSSSLLRYLTRNPTSATKIEQVIRRDRVMGSINIQKTAEINRNRSDFKEVVCNEIHKTNHTPENLILTQILFSILIFCNKYISSAGVLSSGAHLSRTSLDDLNSIRSYTVNLLSTYAIRQLLPAAIENIGKFENLFKLMIEHICLGKSPRNFAGIYRILHKWKFFVWISSKDINPVENTLRYHFFDLKNRDQLYECWVFYKILELLCDTFDFKLSETTYSKGVATFRSTENSIEVTYQGIYRTGWINSENPVYDRPDIVIEFNKNIILILDAKNSIIPPGNRYPYRRQMDSYINSLGMNKTKFAILIFSSGMEKDWKQISRIEDDHKLEQKIIWISLSPSSHTNIRNSNQHAIQKIVDIIKICNSGQVIQ